MLQHVICWKHEFHCLSSSESHWLCYKYILFLPVYTSQMWPCGRYSPQRLSCGKLDWSPWPRPAAMCDMLWDRLWYTASFHSEVDLSSSLNKLPLSQQCLSDDVLESLKYDKPMLSRRLLSEVWVTQCVRCWKCSKWFTKYYSLGTTSLPRRTKAEEKIRRAVAETEQSPWRSDNIARRGSTSWRGTGKAWQAS